MKGPVEKWKGGWEDGKKEGKGGKGKKWRIDGYLEGCGVIGRVGKSYCGDMAWVAKLRKE